jgi:hypothetical protein
MKCSGLHVFAGNFPPYCAVSFAGGGYPAGAARQLGVRDNKFPLSNTKSFRSTGTAT